MKVRPVNLPLHYWQMDCDGPRFPKKLCACFFLFVCWFHLLIMVNSFNAGVGRMTSVCKFFPVLKCHTASSIVILLGSLRGNRSHRKVKSKHSRVGTFFKTVADHWNMCSQLICLFVCLFFVSAVVVDQLVLQLNNKVIEHNDFK